MPWLIVQYDDRPLSSDHQALMARNQAYCKKHNYEYKFLNTGYKDLPPYWRKTKIVKDLLETNNYEGILWLDTDATIYNMDITLESFAGTNNSTNNSKRNNTRRNNSKKKNFYKAINSAGNQIFNAGVWLVKNTKNGHKIMNTWMKQYKPSDWKYDGKSWHTDGPWAGITYEQGSFAFTVVPRYKNSIQTMNEQFLQGTSPRGDVFILHFYNHFKSRIPYFLRDNPL